MSDTLLAVGITVLSLVFQAGGFYIYVRLTFKHLDESTRERAAQLERKVDANFVTLEGKAIEIRDRFKSDLAGIGEKISRIGTLSARRYHNVGVALMLSTPAEHEKEVALLMKEEN